MKEFSICNDKNKIVDEEESIVKACKKAFKINGCVKVRNLKTGDTKEIIKGKTLEYLATR